jgi:hypothetical protein
LPPWHEVETKALNFPENASLRESSGRGEQ